MKKQLLIILIMLLAYSAFGQIISKESTNQSNTFKTLKSFKGDTLRYVQRNFIDNKWKYIGKDLNTLLNDVEIPIKSYLRGYSARNINFMPDITLQFYTFRDALIRDNSSNKSVDIIIVWSQPLPMDSVNLLFHKNKAVWTEEEHKYYGKQIIGDILTTKWSK